MGRASSATAEASRIPRRVRIAVAILAITPWFAVLWISPDWASPTRPAKPVPPTDCPKLATVSATWWNVLPVGNPSPARPSARWRRVGNGVAFATGPGRARTVTNRSAGNRPAAGLYLQSHLHDIGRARGCSEPEGGRQRAAARGTCSARGAWSRCCLRLRPRPEQRSSPGRRAWRSQHSCRVHSLRPWATL